MLEGRFCYLLDRVRLATVGCTLVRSFNLCQAKLTGYWLDLASFKTPLVAIFSNKYLWIKFRIFWALLNSSPSSRVTHFSVKVLYSGFISGLVVFSQWGRADSKLKSAINVCTQETCQMSNCSFLSLYHIQHLAVPFVLLTLYSTHKDKNSKMDFLASMQVGEAGMLS